MYQQLFYLDIFLTVEIMFQLDLELPLIKLNLSIKGF